ncbi:hypothetical protein BJ508DRAFT_205664 [Ascobolus immersus RN42]|uniref:Glycogen debranching enzyme n=1 Tax=Ascobolus immersus RN42 TaxID=1160509 RepID=A0A3N4IL30_ASCIM|nr:hypothetical protein BJ508DRAFT_205664 [Ascobolus immersus RN42]
MAPSPVVLVPTAVGGKTISTATPHTIHVLNLKDDGSPDIIGSYINLPPPLEPYTLRFAIVGGASVCREGTLHVNIPKKGEEFDRQKFQKFELKADFNRICHVDLEIVRPGSFDYYITYRPLPSQLFSDEKLELATTPKHFITVGVGLHCNGKYLPPSSLSIYSVVSKWLGPLTEWDKQFEYVARKGYNMIHFTPLNHRGGSNSPYSLRDQLTFDPEIFTNGEKDVRQVLEMLEHKHGLLSITDVVWNHTAPESVWLQEHPDAGYNLITAPWLESAYALDDALLEFSGKLGALGLPTVLKDKEDLLRVMDALKTHVIGTVRLWEYYVVDAKKNVESILAAWKQKERKREPLAGDTKKGDLYSQAMLLAQVGLRGADRLGERFRRHIDPDAGAVFLDLHYGAPKGTAEVDEEDEHVSGARKFLERVLDELNLPNYKEYDVDCSEILEQLYNRISYQRLDPNGPKYGPISQEHPLAEVYFTRLPHNKITAKHQPGELFLVNNGWVWNANALKDFAGPDSRAYLRREVISWGDCVKLRYGKSKEDSPYLWEHMQKYTEQMAACFHGFRIDNCHSTPVHVAQTFLDAARRVRNDLYVFAELFTGNENTDKVFVQQLGLNSLIREAMQAWSTGELSRLVHKHGGLPIGSFHQEDKVNRISARGSEGSNILPVAGVNIHALFMDCTHDNEMPYQKRFAADTLPNGALVAMCDCAVGSVAGYDEVYPKHLDVVNEKRRYQQVADKEWKGIGEVKKVFNQVHAEMGRDGYTEMHVHHEGEYITVHRVHPKTHRGYFLIAHTAVGNKEGRGEINPIVLTGTKVKTIGSWYLKVDDSEETYKSVLADKELVGLPSTVENIDPVKIEEKEENGSFTTTLTVPDTFPPGSVTLIETWIPGAGDEGGLSGIDNFLISGADEAVENLDLIELNYFLYRADAEERDTSEGRDGVYVVPGHGALVYAGLQGWWSVLEPMVLHNDLGSKIAQHLREGLWPLEYIIGRLEKGGLHGPKPFEKARQWFQERLDKIRPVPGFLRPRYVALIVKAAFDAAWAQGVKLMNQEIQDGTEFVQRLAMVGIQCTGLMKSTSLWPNKTVPCLAAGLPHFAVEYMRCWGRDIFISLRGLYLVTGRFDEAKEHILAFASVVKHGMIPNLLDGGRRPRYNSRDSIWFFLQAIQDYVKIVPNGEQLLKEKVKRRFLPYDDTWFDFDDERAYSKESTIEEVIQEALQRHAWGMQFTEANAGLQIDSQMRWEGFQQKIWTEWETGFIYGGNRWNCGTWMDKMGESERAGTKGVPGTPRDGADVEIIGMLYSTLVWVQELHSKGLYKETGVTTSQDSDAKTVTFKQWAAAIQKSFHKYFYVPLDESEDKNFVVEPSLIRRRGIYKDCLNPSLEYTAYQFRPNFLITLVVAPSLFPKEIIPQVLGLTDKTLVGPLGVATLDPSDPEYHPYYHNSEDSDNPATSKGRNYHQGPEWVWPRGYFLRALVKEGVDDKAVWVRLKGIREQVTHAPWRGVTELTQVNGQYCADSCETQAWSSGCAVEVAWDAGRVSQMA